MHDDGYAVPCEDLLEWAMWIETGRQKWQLIDTIEGFRVSTIFLGLDHNWGNGDPLLWETMIFDHNHEYTAKIFRRKMQVAPDIGQWRFSFKEEAYQFHRDKVKELTDRFAAIGMMPLQINTQEQKT